MGSYMGNESFLQGIMATNERHAELTRLRKRVEVLEAALRELYKHAEIRMARGIDDTERAALDNALTALTNTTESNA